jgi:two-component system sensor histidine kinase QseC
VYTEAVDWHRVLEKALSDCLPLLDGTGSEVAVSWPEQGAPLALTGDEALLATLVRNLVDNALRYSPPRSLVAVRFTADSLVIEDQGTGLAEADLARLGDRFYRPAGQAQSGSGLGISIVRRVAELHGLDVRFENRGDGRGLRVTVTRPDAAAG